MKNYKLRTKLDIIYNHARYEMVDTQSIGNIFIKLISFEIMIVFLYVLMSIK